MLGMARGLCRDPIYFSRNSYHIYRVTIELISGRKNLSEVEGCRIRGKGCFYSEPLADEFLRELSCAICFASDSVNSELSQ